MGDLLARTFALDLARSKLGVVERPTNKVEFNIWYYGSDVSAPWCDTYASWVTFNAGAPIPATTSKGAAYVPSTVNYAKAHGMWIPATQRHLVQPADECVFSFGGTRPDHIEMVETPRDPQGRLINIGGNTTRPGGSGSQRDGGGVWRRVRASSIIGFVRPPYPADPPPTPTPVPTDEENPVEKYFIIRFGDAPGTGDDDAGRWAWFPGINRKTFISADAFGGWLSGPDYRGERLMLRAEVENIKNLGDD